MTFDQSSLNELLSQVRTSLSAAWGLNYEINDDPFALIRPEYLTTVLMAQQLLKWLRANSSSLKLRLEESTNRSLSQIFGMHRLGASFSQVGRPGNVDLVLTAGTPEKPIVLIENKNRISGFNSIEDDVVRNKEFLNASSGKGIGSVIAALSTFYWLQKSGVTTADHDQKADRSFRDIKKKVGNCLKGSGIHYAVLLKHRLHSSAFETLEQAELKDEETGQRAGDLHSPESLYGGIVAMWRNDRLNARSTAGSALAALSLDSY